MKYDETVYQKYYADILCMMEVEYKRNGYFHKFYLSRN